MSNEKNATGARAACLTVLVAVLLTGCAGQETAQIDITPNIQTACPTSAPAETPAETPVASPVAEKTPVMTAPLEPQPAKTSEGRTVAAEGFYYEKLDDAIKARKTGMSNPEEGGDIAYADLRYIVVKYRDFDGVEHSGELIANRKVARELCEIFMELYAAGYPIARMRLVDDYGEPGDDNLSMADNNTSSFNYRRVTGSGTLSRHSYGLAVDINPVMNPYIDGSRIAPPNAEPYADRSKKLPGMIDHDDLCYKLFTDRGWKWGGDWDEPDYQHFSKSP